MLAGMTVSADAARTRLARERARRRDAINMLRIAECGCRYASQQLANANGTGPEEARAAVLEMAGELAECAEAVRRVVKLSAAERRGLAIRLAALGGADAADHVAGGGLDPEGPALRDRPVAAGDSGPGAS
jgi:hypothetical protein